MELVCYTYEGWAPRIRPASTKRDWMEGTPERFAYRCLPLAIANAHGWEILSPCGFEARWTGGEEIAAVEIRLDPGADPRRAPVSLFGQATLTFHVEALFRTPEGWNLWVGGSPNDAKDGIAPLGGVIETDWSPYSFTMNWRFTRPDHWVRFEENEPFCFFFPVQRGLLAGIAPEIRRVEEDPELKAAFETWSRSRDEFRKWVDEANPQTPTDKWQKLYYRGVRPDGGDGAPDHESKLRLERFRLPDGSALQTGECPARKPPAPKPAPTPAILAPAKPAEPVRAGDQDLALKRRDWILDVMEKQRGLSELTRGLPRIPRLPPLDFLDFHYAPGRPVVIEGELAGWPALRRWTPAYLREAIGDAPVELEKDHHKEVVPFSAYMDMIGKGEGDGACITAGNAAALAPLQRDLGALDKYLDRAPGMMRIGAAGTFIPLQFDLTNNFIAQIVGRQRAILLPPSESRRLHHSRDVFSDVGDIEDEARLALYPSAREARRFEVDLGPGDLLYVPIGWWHQLRSLEFGVTSTYTNFRWPNEGRAAYPADGGAQA